MIKRIDVFNRFVLKNYKYKNVYTWSDRNVKGENADSIENEFRMVFCIPFKCFILFPQSVAGCHSTPSSLVQKQKSIFYWNELHSLFI